MNKKRLLLFLAALCLASPGNTAFAAKQPPLKKKKSASFEINTSFNCEKNLGNSELEQEFFLCETYLQKAENKNLIFTMCHRCKTFVSVQEAMCFGDNPFCKKCSICCKCYKSIETKTIITRYNNDIICSKCSVCIKCTESTATSEDVAIFTTENTMIVFCEKCFKCSQCKKRPHNDNFSVYLKDNEIFACCKNYRMCKTRGSTYLYTARGSTHE